MLGGGGGGMPFLFFPCITSGMLYWKISESWLRLHHRRRIKTEEKAKVVASVFGEEFIQFLVALAVLPMTVLNNKMNCTRMI